MKMQCQCILRSGPRKGQQCQHPAKYPTHFCGHHRECFESLLEKKETSIIPVSQPRPKEQKIEEDRKNPMYFKTGTDLREDEKKWCRCVLHVASQQTDQCLENPTANAFKIFNGRQCYNPYSVCASRIKTTSRRCGDQYDFTKIPDNELRAYAIMKHLTIPKPYDRMEMIKTISDWKEQFV